MMLMTSPMEVVWAVSKWWFGTVLTLLKQWATGRGGGGGLHITTTQLNDTEEDHVDASNSPGGEGPCLLDLPDLALDAILACLPAKTLCCLALACRDLHTRCGGDHLWAPLAGARWGRVSTHQKWRPSYVLKPLPPLSQHRIWPFNCIRRPALPRQKCSPNLARKQSESSSILAWYGAMEAGTCWFPAQVYNREHGHIGFMLSCYDAVLCYDPKTDTFHARYPPHGPRTCVIEEGVGWERLRVPPVATLAHELHVSDCLPELRPGDHVEVQWRRNKAFPFGWWYGVVGHVDTCESIDSRYCRCHLEDSVWLEFNQYMLGSRWRRAEVNRRRHSEAGNESQGYYGGIRKLHTKEEISTWKQLWPTQTLE